MSVACVIIKGGGEVWQIEARPEPAIAPVEEESSSPSRPQWSMSFTRPLTQAIREQVLTFMQRSSATLTKAKEELVDLKNESLKKLTEQTKHWLLESKQRTAGYLENLSGTYKLCLLGFAAVYTVAALWDFFTDVKHAGELYNKLMFEVGSNNRIAADETSQQLTVFVVFICGSQGFTVLSCLLPFLAEFLKRPGYHRCWFVCLFYAMVLQFFRIFYICYLVSASDLPNLYYMAIPIWNFSIICTVMWVTGRRAEEMRVSREVQEGRIQAAIGDVDEAFSNEFGGPRQGVRRTRRHRRSGRSSGADREVEITSAQPLVLDLPPSYAEIEIEQEFWNRSRESQLS